MPIIPSIGFASKTASIELLGTQPATTVLAAGKYIVHQISVYHSLENPSTGNNEVIIKDQSGNTIWHTLIGGGGLFSSYDTCSIMSTPFVAEDGITAECDDATGGVYVVVAYDGSG